MELRYKSKDGCPIITKGKIEKFVDDNKILVASLMIGLGSLLAFAGYYFLIFINSVIIFASFTLTLSYYSLTVGDTYYGAG